MMSEPPEPGTPMESLLIMVWKARQELEIVKTRAVAQAALCAGAQDANSANKELQESWRGYVDQVFPFKRRTREDADAAAIRYLANEAAKGPLTVTPLQSSSRGKSKLRTRYLNAEDKS